MPRRSLDRSLVMEAAVRGLGREGPMPARKLRESLGVSHATLARLVKLLQQEGRIICMGQGRATTYGAPRPVADLPQEIPFYEILEDGKSRVLGRFHLVRPTGLFISAESPDIEGGAVPDLPHYLFDLRPSGFLGRMIPKMHQELGLPEDIRVWNGDTTLRFLVRRGWNQIGSLIVGETAFQQHLLEGARQPHNSVDHLKRDLEYPRLARDGLAIGTPGSSAAGEQPKFLATVMPERQAVLVKFSPPMVDALTIRVGDLLVAEHLALKTLADYGQAAARSQVIIAEKQVFLEVERFDRTPHGGRRGLLSLLALDSQYVGGLGTWSASVLALAKLGIVPRQAVQTTLWLETFSQLIANSDRHFGNLSFFARGARITSLAPAYDVLPMLYAPVANQLVERTFEPPPPEPRLGKIYGEVCAAARTFWRRVTDDERISADFRAIAASNQARIAGFEQLATRLP